MKILVAYDGSKCAEAAIDDLARAGLPPTGSADVLAVAEIWMPTPESVEADSPKASNAYMQEAAKTFKDYGEKALTEAGLLVKHAERRIRTTLPGWTVTPHSTYGSPAREILSMAADLRSDLTVLGSHGTSALSRFTLGSIAHKVLTEADCSVRVTRGKVDVEPPSERILIGFDGSKGALAAVQSVAARNWHEGSEVRVVIASEPVMPSSIGRFVPPICRVADEVNVTERRLFEQISNEALEMLRGAGLKARMCIRAGSPKHVLSEEAERWGADCIFVGACSLVDLAERDLLGSTSAAVAARAHCSVEVAREKALSKTGVEAYGRPDNLATWKGG